MELKQMEYFQVLCETQNITKAAEKLYLSRQSLSVSMKNLEKDLGVSLFLRKKEGISLTESGEIFYAFVKKQSKLLSACRAQIAIQKNRQKEVIRLGLASGLYLPDEIERWFAFEQQNFLVTLDIVDICCVDSWSMMQEGTLDMAYTVRPPAALKLRSIPLYQSEQYILLSTSSLLARSKTVDFLRDLPGMTLLETENRMSQYTSLLQGLNIKIKMVQGDPNLLKAMLVRNKGVVVTLPSLVERYRDEKICVKPLTNLPAELNLDPCLVYRPDITANAKEFLRYLCRIDGVVPPSLDGQAADPL